MSEQKQKSKVGRKPIDEDAIIEQAIAICKRGGCVSLMDVIAYLPINSTVFYKHFPSGSEKHTRVMEALADSKRKACVSIRGRLYASQNPTALITVYRMLCTEEERDAISLTKTDITSKGEQIKNEPLVVEIIDKSEQVEKTE